MTTDDTTLKANITAYYAEKEIENQKFIALFVETYKAALAGDANAMAKGQEMYDSSLMAELSPRVQAAMTEAGLA